MDAGREIFYTLVRYVEDVFDSSEPVNVGIIVVDPEANRTYSRFRTQVGNSDKSRRMLRAMSLSWASSPGWQPSGEMDCVQMLNQAAESNVNEIRFDPPTLCPELNALDALDSLYSLLVERPSRSARNEISATALVPTGSLAHL